MRLVEQVQKADDIPGGVLLVLFRKLCCESRVRQCFYPALHMAAAMKIDLCQASFEIVPKRIVMNCAKYLGV